MPSSSTTLEQILKRFAKEGELYQQMDEGVVRCHACGHRCLIKKDRSGVCKVRFNDGGKLFVPHGYVGGIQCDPIEKKPFFHAYSGARALSFGMLGCDFHCGYCFTPESYVFTTEGPLEFKRLFDRGEKLEGAFAKSVRTLQNIGVYDHSGKISKITKVFEHSYDQTIVELKAAFVPKIKATLEHPLLVIPRPERGHLPRRPEFVPADHLTKNHCLAIPKHFSFSKQVALDTYQILRPFESFYHIKKGIPLNVIRKIQELSERGCASREIAKLVKKSPSHVRHLRRKSLFLNEQEENSFLKPAVLLRESGRVRFVKERRPGIAEKISFTGELAELLGYYCAEGCMVKEKKRVHAAHLSFSFGKHEIKLAGRARKLIKKIFAVPAYLSKRTTTLTVVTAKSSVALLFEALCGGRGSEKKVPAILFEAKREIVEQFLKGYVAGDGFIHSDGQIRVSTVSETLAYGVAALVLKLGYLPSVYRYRNKRNRKILGRQIRQAPFMYLVRWYGEKKKRRHLWEDQDYFYVLIERIARRRYKGKVYNLECIPRHTYLAPFVAAHNCQNWITSQALRDPASISVPEKTDPDTLIELAKRQGARVLASTYNEPLITSEWAVHIFKLAKKAGFATAYISNGNGTTEVLDYIRPWVDLYKIDLKTFNDRSYRELGGVLDNVLLTVKQVFERGFWLEVVTLIIPGFNDSHEELTKVAEFLAGISPDIPWHVTAFHKDYKMTGPENTSVETLLRAVVIGEKAGLHYVYAGNIPGQVGEYENTRCPSCKETLIRRFGFKILSNRLEKGRCFKCRTLIPGVWE